MVYLAVTVQGVWLVSSDGNLQLMDGISAELIGELALLPSDGSMWIAHPITGQLVGWNLSSGELTGYSRHETSAIRQSQLVHDIPQLPTPVSLTCHNNLAACLWETQINLYDLPSGTLVSALSALASPVASEWRLTAHGSRGGVLHQNGTLSVLQGPTVVQQAAALAPTAAAQLCASWQLENLEAVHWLEAITTAAAKGERAEAVHLYSKLAPQLSSPALGLAATHDRSSCVAVLGEHSTGAVNLNSLPLAPDSPFSQAVYESMQQAISAAFPNKPGAARAARGFNMRDVLTMQEAEADAAALSQPDQLLAAVQSALGLPDLKLDHLELMLQSLWLLRVLVQLYCSLHLSDKLRALYRSLTAVLEDPAKAAAEIVVWLPWVAEDSDVVAVIVELRAAAGQLHDAVEVALAAAIPDKAVQVIGEVECHVADQRGAFYVVLQYVLDHELHPLMPELGALAAQVKPEPLELVKIVQAAICESQSANQDLLCTDGEPGWRMHEFSGLFCNSTQ